MMEGEKSKKSISKIESPRPKWKRLDGQGIESTSTFAHFRGIILEEEDRQSKAIPLVLAREELQRTNTDKRIQTVSEQVNWENVSLRGMTSYTFVTNDYAKRRHTYQLQVSANNIFSYVKNLNQRVAEIKDVVGTTIGFSREEKYATKIRNEELK
jgi:hypothetical protein